MKTFQELADEAFRDLLHKYKRPTDLKAALRESAKGEVSGRRRPRARKPRPPKRVHDATGTAHFQTVPAVKSHGSARSRACTAPEGVS
jgi:hypothetical protein